LKLLRKTEKVSTILETFGNSGRKKENPIGKTYSSADGKSQF